MNFVSQTTRYTKALLDMWVSFIVRNFILTLVRDGVHYSDGCQCENCECGKN